MITDPISDMLTRMRNAIGARQTKVDVPASRLKVEVARILKEEGYITNYSIKTAEGSNIRTLRIFLRYGPKGESVISHLQRVSKPSRRVYLPNNEIPKVLGGLGINILSTSKGVMTGKLLVKPTLAAKYFVSFTNVDCELLWCCALAARSLLATE